MTVSVMFTSKIEKVAKILDDVLLMGQNIHVSSLAKITTIWLMLWYQSPYYMTIYDDWKIFFKY